MTRSEHSSAIVVGMDGSEASEAALDWAATQAAAEGRPLVLLTAMSSPGPESSAWLTAHGITTAQVRAQAKERARSFARRCTVRVRERYPDLDVRHDIRFDDPRDALLEADAGLVVVGTRGRGPVRRLLLGSVASTVVKHATCPTVVVRPAPGSRTRHGVLVGVAGDAGDAAAVDLAFRLAVARGLPVTAFHGFWDVLTVDEVREVPEDDPDCDAERKLLAVAVEDARRRHPEVEVRPLLVRGFADQSLLHASRSADLLVLGHRRKPFLKELIYGSVAPRVAEHARCSVAVVPYEDRDQDRADATTSR